MRILPVMLCALTLPLLAGCGGNQTTTDMETGNTIVASGSSGKMTLGVNSYLWHASLDTLSFMPLASADPFGGVIITDWYTPPETPNERFKLNVYILDRQLRADGIKATVFRQSHAPDGRWVDMTVDPKTATDLENAILTRARQLRVNTAQSSS